MAAWGLEGAVLGQQRGARLGHCLSDLEQTTFLLCASPPSPVRWGLTTYAPCCHGPCREPGRDWLQGHEDNGEGHLASLTDPPPNSPGLSLTHSKQKQRVREPWRCPR